MKANKKLYPLALVSIALILILVFSLSTVSAANEQSTSLMGPFAYITNWEGNTVSIIDTATDTVTATVNVGYEPLGVAVTPDGKKVYVTQSWRGDYVSVIDTSTNTVTATVNVGYAPVGIAVTPDGKKVYVTNQEGTVSVIDTETNTVIATVNVGNYPWGVAVTPDGTKAYISNYWSNTISVINTTTDTITATVSVGSYPLGIAFNLDGTKVYVANQGESQGSGTISMIDTDMDTVTATFNVGDGPTGIAISSDGSKIYVTNCGVNTVSVISTLNNTITATINVGTYPWGVAVTPDGKKVYVANHGSNTVSVIDAATNTVKSTLNVGSGPIAFGQFIVPPQSIKPVLPEANFSSNVTEGYAPLSVQFNDCSENATEVSWDFDNNGIVDSTDRTPIHVYDIPGKYTVNLTATNGNGTSSKLATITVLEKTVPASYWQFSPQEPVCGDILRITGSTSPGEKVDVFINFEKTVPVSEGKFEYTLEDVKIPEGLDNSFTVEASGVENLNVSAKLVVWITKSSEASGDTAIVSQSNVPAGTYKIKIDGHAREDVSTVNLKITAFQRIEADSNGEFSYSYDTTAFPPGKFEVKIGETTKEITIKPKEQSTTWIPVANFSTNVTSGYAPLSVQFTDLSENSTEWNWSFGDGTYSSEQNPTHTYSTAGNYTVSLTANNSAGSNTVMKQDYIIAAKFKDAIIWGYAPLSVQFTDLTENATSWKWNFGDSSTSTEQNPTHTYSEAGQYAVTLTVNNVAGSNTATYTSYISVVNSLEAPVAAFSANPAYGKLPLNVSFTDKSMGSPTSWKWNFGDGNTSTEQNPVHTYAKTGQYTVTLTSNNVAGSSTVTKYKYISIANSLNAPITAFSAEVLS